MTVPYAPPLTGSLPWGDDLREALVEGPEFGRTARATRWHRVRSGQVWIAGYDPDTLREAYSFWCGQHGKTHANSPVLLADELPAGEPLCGTCEGRALGSDDTRPDLIFTPRTLVPPKVCPGSRTSLYTEDPDRWNRATCLVCHDYVKLRAYGGGAYYSGSYGPQRHPPGPGLVPGCPFHAWRSLRRYADDVIACSCDT